MLRLRSLGWNGHQHSDGWPLVKPGVVLWKPALDTTSTAATTLSFLSVFFCFGRMASIQTQQSEGQSTQMTNYDLLQKNWVPEWFRNERMLNMPLTQLREAMINLK